MLTRVDYDYVAELEAKVKELREYERGWAKPHVWNFIAKTLREAYPEKDSDHTNFERKLATGARRNTEYIALAFAKRFQDEEGFDPMKFLDQCSPDPEQYPISELWEE